MKEKIKNILRGPMIPAIFYIALGILLALLPVESVHVICKIVFGVVMILAGIYHVLIHLLETKNATFLDLFSGVILTVFGVFLFMNPLIVIKLLPVLLGAFIAADSLWTIKGAIRMKRRKRDSWKILILGSMIFTGLGVTLIVNPFKVIRYTIIFAGIVFISNGILDLLFWGLISYGIKKGNQVENQNEEEEIISEQQDTIRESLQPVYEDWSQHKTENENQESLAEDMELRSGDGEKTEEEVLTGPDSENHMEV